MKPKANVSRPEPIMTLDEFENALHKLLDDAVAGGLDAEDVQQCADATVNNYFLDETCEDYESELPKANQ